MFPYIHCRPGSIHGIGSLPNVDLDQMEENDEGEDSKPRKKVDDRPLPWYTIFIVFGVGIVLISYVHHFNNKLPIPLSIEDEGTHFAEFIAERANNYVRQMCTIGPRVTGSYQNEVLMVDFLTREIGFILQTAGSKHKISSNVQKPSTCFNVNIPGSPGFTNCYSDIQNIAVKISPAHTISREDSIFGQETPFSSNDVLISCHFDSSSRSPGCSSSGFHCGIMLELLRILSRSDEDFKNGVVFLFNGAKENEMQGSHGFITQHEWAKDVKVFVNLDSFGSGGKEVLFQVGPEYPWMLEVYRYSVPYPSAQGILDMLSTYLMDEDTDFDRFTNIGKKTGLGFANFANGYVYHTSNDVASAIPLGSYQHTGENVLALVTQLIVSEDLTTSSLSHSTGTPVYFDVFGEFVVTYSECTAVVVNVLTAIFSVVVITQHVCYLKSCLGEEAQKEHVRLTLELSVTGHVIALVSTSLLAGLLDLASISMSWYTRQWLIFPLYLGLVLMGHILMGRRVEKHRGPQISRVASAQMSLLAAQTLMTGILILVTFAAPRLSYMFVLLIICPTVTMFAMTVCDVHKDSRVFLIGYLTSLIFPVVLILSHADIFLSVLIPFYGRSVTEKLSPDKAMALFMTFFGGMVVAYLAPLIILVRYAGRVLTWLVAVPLFVLILVRVSSLGFPYGTNPLAPTQQRINVLHTERTFYSTLDKVRRYDSGFWVVPSDVNTHATLASIDIRVMPVVDLNSDCKLEAYCGLPLFDVKHRDHVGNSYWVPAPPPVIHSAMTIEITTRKMVSVTVRKIGFMVRGPDHMFLLISPLRGFKLAAWSFTENVPAPSGSRDNDRDVYGITLGRGFEDKAWAFSLSFEIPMGNLSATATDIALVGHYMHTDQPIPEHVKQFTARFPKWTDVTLWTSSYKAWVV